jgi:hypothetical protein
MVAVFVKPECLTSLQRFKGDFAPLSLFRIAFSALLLFG